MIYAANLFREDTLSRWCATEVDSEGVMVPVSVFRLPILKGSYYKKIFYCPNLIFWILMGCGKAGFGQKNT